MDQEGGRFGGKIRRLAINQSVVKKCEEKHIRKGNV